MKRIGSAIGLPAENTAEYERLHRDVWPGVQQQISRSNVRNYSIFRFGEVLFSYFEYVGDDFEADIAAMAADPTMQQWWALCSPLQRAYDERAEGEWWMQLPELYHQD